MSTGSEGIKRQRQQEEHKAYRGCKPHRFFPLELGGYEGGKESKYEAEEPG